jgi:peptidoglycan-associated lipoprotein
MFQPARISRIAVATLALALVAGCAAPPPHQAAKAAPSAAEPELAGAWYQVYFDSNKIEINERGQMIVKNVAYVVANTNGARVTVIGKTDRSGDAATNMALSQKRADQVRDALVAAGVPSSRIDTSWTGEAKQEIATADNTAEQRNRVVDITVVKPQGTAYRQGN